MTLAEADSVIDFWFREITPKAWFHKSDAFDSEVAARFGEVLNAAVRGELWSWRATAEGRLAEIIVIDQFSRNIHRGQPQSFSNDPVALILAQTAVELGADKALGPDARAFLYMPYMHSESAIVHLEAVRLFSQPGLERNLDFEIRHKAVIDRFGRFPHRNEILGRASTPEELEFLLTPGSSF
ncbi:MAG: hypothetical protein CFE28_00155 [Alphaproteobacteria bacterium PA2]|nr:MAG: hypothetical protein CFE28_00155 [Alphaproteobacteria bacterium PA2]